MSVAKLSSDQRMICLRMHSEGIGETEIANYVKTEYNVTITPKGIRDTVRAKKYQPIVKEFKDRYMAEVRSVPIANKRIRLDDIERERNRINRLIEKNPKNTKSEVKQYIALVAELRRLVDTAREEMERKPNMFQNVVIGMGDMSDEALHHRKEELVNRFNRVSDGGRVTGVDSDSGGTESEDTQ